jgi:hypothetical protein
MVEVERSSGEAIFDAVMYEPETRLFSDRAWAILQKELPKARVLAVNVSHLAKEGNVRDAVGEGAGRNLRSLLGCVFQRLGGEKVQASQPYGDQLTAAHDDDAYLQDLAGGISEVAAKICVYARRDDGSAVVHRGLDFKYATGATYGEADSASMGAGERGATWICADGELGAAIAQARGEGYLMLDGDLLARQGTRDRYIPWAPSRRWIPRGPVWPSDLEAILQDAAAKGSYFETARELVWAASRAAIAGRLAERVARNESSSVVAGSFSSYVDGVQTLSCVSHATLYDDYEGTRSIAELSYEEQNELVRSVFDKAGDCRALAVASDVKKAQVEGLWTLVVLLGCSLETAGRIGNFEKRDLNDNLRIVRSLAGTILHQRLASAFGVGDQAAKPVAYDWLELETPAIPKLLQSRAADPFPLVQREILRVLKRAPLREALPPLPVAAPPPLPAIRSAAARAVAPTAVAAAVPSEPKPARAYRDPLDVWMPVIAWIVAPGLSMLAVWVFRVLTR